MFNEQRLNKLQEDEIIKLYELFFGPILMRKETEFYLESLKTLLNKESSVDKAMSKLNTLEIEIIKQLSLLSQTPCSFLNEKLSIIMGEHPSLLGKMLQNLINKNYIFLRDNMYLFVPELLSSRYIHDSIHALQMPQPEKHYDCANFSDVINVIAYFISRGLKFSKSGGLYKKDFEIISTIFSAAAGYMRDEYDIIGYFFSTTFLYEDELLLEKLRSFFALSQLQRMLLLVKTVFPYLQPLISQVYQDKCSYRISKSDLKQLFKTLLLATVLNTEPYRADFDNILAFLTKIGICEIEDDFVIFVYYQESDGFPMELKVTNNFSIYSNSCNTDCDYYLCALFGEFVKYDKITEFEINDRSICRAIQTGCSYEQFENFIVQHSIELGLNVSTTIKEWFDRHNSFFFVEGTVFFAESPEKGHTITRLIDSGMLHAFPVKKDAIFLIPPEEKELFFSFLSRSNFTFYEKKPRKKTEKDKNQIAPPEYQTFLTFDHE